jgi:hypothetical protein
MKKVAKKKSARYVIVRTYSAGCFAGELVSEKGREVVLNKARRLWYWKGSASLSQLATTGTSAPSECQFPAPVDGQKVYEAIEMLPVTEAGRKSIEGVPVWIA